jgi:phage shock protein A
MPPEIHETESPSFVEMLERLERLARALRTGDLEDRLSKLPDTVAEAHALKRRLVDRAVEVREAIACLRGNARPASSV